MDLVTQFPVVATVVGLLMAGHALALAVVALTPTPRDDRIVGKAYRVIEYVAGVIGRAKDQPGERKE